jgi:hypothetical protein
MESKMETVFSDKMVTSLPGISTLRVHSKKTLRSLHWFDLDEKHYEKSMSWQVSISNRNFFPEKWCHLAAKSVFDESLENDERYRKTLSETSKADQDQYHAIKRQAYLWFVAFLYNDQKRNCFL